MASRTVPFRQADLTRAVKGLAKGGVRVERVSISPDGTMSLHTSASTAFAEDDDAELRARLDAFGAM